MGTPSRFFLIMNPGSQSFRSGSLWPSIFAHLRARQATFDFALTERPGHATELARSAARAGFDVVVAVGGDGTINEVINGLFLPGNAHQKNEPSAAGTPSVSAPSMEHFGYWPSVAGTLGRAAFGVIYTGTSPDFCRYHKIPLETASAVDLLLSENRKSVDLCRITHRASPEGDLVESVFSCSANFGLGAAVARGANSGLRAVWGDVFGTLFSLLGALSRYQAPTFRIAIDGRERLFPGVFNIFSGKNPLVASGIKLRLNISSNDGNLYLLPLYGVSKLRILGLIPRIYNGSITERFPPIYGKKIEILEWGNAPEVEFDGDPRGFLPAKLEILPRALRLVS